MKQDLIKKWYNPELTDEQNVSLLKEHGISISKRTLVTWRKNQGIAKQRGGDRKSIDFKNQSANKVSSQIKVSSEYQSEKEMPQKGGHNGISDTFSPKRYNYPPEEKKRLIRQPPHLKKN